MFILVLKLLIVKEDALHEVANLCGKKGKINLDHSMTDVQWDPIEGNYEFDMPIV